MHHRSENVRGDINDVIKVARQSLNRCNASRVISKQECMVELTSLPLVLCSEQIDKINISGALRIKTSNSYGEYTQSLLQKYQNRHIDYEDITFCQFVHMECKKKYSTKTVIPHFIGMTSSPVYPPTVSYARATLIIHMPWRNASFHTLSDSECIYQFNKGVKDKKFPTSVLISYEKVYQQHTENRKNLEPLQTTEPYETRDEGLSKEDTDMIRAMSSITANMAQNVTLNGNQYDRGVEYDWSKRIYPVSLLHTNRKKKIVSIFLHLHNVSRTGIKS